MNGQQPADAPSVSVPPSIFFDLSGKMLAEWMKVGSAGVQ